MKRVPVYSSNISSIGYDEQTRTLEIEFKHGGVYQYYNVPESVFTGLMNASSHGSYFDANIRKAGYSYRKI